MCARMAVGDEAPNFDLSSTEDAVLTLYDEAARKTLILYFVPEVEGQQAREDLAALGRAQPEVHGRNARILVISPAKMPVLKGLQAELKLPFPLLRDDRDFSSVFGVEAAPEGASPAPALLVVNRRSRVLWVANPVSSVAQVLPQVLELLKTQPSPTESYPKKLVNRWVDRWVN